MNGNKTELCEKVLNSAVSVPGVKVDRNSFLKQSFKMICSEDQIIKAIETSPAAAGIDLDTINKLARSSIEFETNKVTLLSAVAGFPGGWALLGTVPADLAQFYAHILRILQKLAYLYSWPDMRNEQGEFDDETLHELTLFVGIMFGVNLAVGVISEVADLAAKQAIKKIPRIALTKTAFYPILKKLAGYIGIKITKDTFAKSISKVIPFLVAVLSGGITYITFKPMANRLKDNLSSLPLANPEIYKEAKNDKSTTFNDQDEVVIIDVDFNEVDFNEVDGNSESESN